MYLVTYYSQEMVAQALDLARETYFAILRDRDSNGPVMVWHCIYCSKTNMDFIEIISNLINNVSRILSASIHCILQVGSPQGGMDIEEVAEKTPHLIFKV